MLLAQYCSDNRDVPSNESNKIEFTVMTVAEFPKLALIHGILLSLLI